MNPGGSVGYAHIPIVVDVTSSPLSRGVAQ